MGACCAGELHGNSLATVVTSKNASNEPETVELNFPVVKQEETDVSQNSHERGRFTHETLASVNPGCLTDHYEIEAQLGSGAYGTVSKAFCKSSGQSRAVKAVSRSDADDVDKWRREVTIMSKLDHPFIIKLFEIFETQHETLLVLELCRGGELLDRLQEDEQFTEREAAIVFKQVMSAVNYLHLEQICHRDIQPGNLLFTSDVPIAQSTLKLSNFAWACTFTPDQILKRLVGTPAYVAPEVLQRSYDCKVDVWSCGVIMFELLTGTTPFDGDNDKQVIRKVRAFSKLELNPEEWSSISDDAKQLVTALLEKDASKRLSAAEALNHVWMKENAPKAKGTPLSTHVRSLRNFAAENELQKAALHVIAANLKDSVTDDLRDTFVSLDVNGRGVLTMEEIEIGFKKAGHGSIPVDLQDLLASMNTDGTGLIKYTEFLAATLSLNEEAVMKEDVLKSAFNKLNMSGGGAITKGDLKQLLNESDCTPSSANNENKEHSRASLVMIDAGCNDTGTMSYATFKTMMEKGVKGQN